MKEKDLEFDPSLTPDVSFGRWFFFNSITKKGYKTMVEFMLNLMLKDGIQESVAHNAAFQAGFVAVKAPFAVVETAASIVPGMGSFVGAGGPHHVPCRECKCPNRDASRHKFVLLGSCELDSITLRPVCH